MRSFFSFYRRFVFADEFLLLRFIQVFILISITLYLSPYVILGFDNHWMIWDNLDFNFVNYKILLDSGVLFSSNETIVEQILGGVPRGTMPSEFDAFVWLYKIFGAEGAYIVNRILMTIFGFTGIYLLLRQHVLKEKEDEIIRLGASLCFSILPFWPFGGLSVAGMPLALYAMLEIRQKNFSFWNWAIVVFYPFYSSLILSGFFFLIFVTGIWLYDLVRHKLLLPLFSALTIMSLFYIVSHYRLFIDLIFSSGFVSHRVEFESFNQGGWGEALRNSLNIFISGQNHAHSLQRLIILPIIAISVFSMLPSKKNERQKWLFWIIMIAIGAIALLYGFIESPLVSTIMQPIKAVIPIQFDRFYFLCPLFWTLAFALVLSTFRMQSPSLGLLIICIIIFQTVYEFRHHEFIANRGGPSVKEFFAKEQFKEIQNYIGQPLNTYRVGSIGIHPSVPLFNGFYTVDGYSANYSLFYKHAFRKIIAGELEKDVLLKKYFDDWGSRVYLFNAQLGTNWDQVTSNNLILNNLDYNWEAFYNLGGRYLFSALEIDINSSPQLKFKGQFNHKASARPIYLYEVFLNY